MSKRKGRPPGIKETKKRVRLHDRVIAPPDVQWLNKTQAAAELGTSVSFINRHLDVLGATKVGDLVRFYRPRLNECALRLPTAKPISSPDNRRKREPAAATAD